MRYRGVGDAMSQILAKEGVGGLYRGITPRLLIYKSQGAIFFASYEMIKRVRAVLCMALLTSSLLKEAPELRDFPAKKGLPVGLNRLPPPLSLCLSHTARQGA